MEQLGECKCLKPLYKKQLIELVEDEIESEIGYLGKLKKGTPAFDYILEDKSRHEDLLKVLKSTPEC